MKSKIFTLLCMLLIFEVSAQSLGSNTIGQLDPRALRGNQPLKPHQNVEIEIKGHPFATDEWYDGSVFLKDSSLLDDPTSKFKLNVEDSEIWVLLSDKSERVLTDDRIGGLALKQKDTVIAYRKVVIPESPTNPCFAQIIYWGEHFSLVKYIKKTFVPADYVDKGLVVVGKKYDSYDRQESYYIGTSDKKMSKIKLSKGDILKATATVSRQKREEILQYCKDNDIRNPIDEEDAALMLAFINSL